MLTLLLLLLGAEGVLARPSSAASDVAETPLPSGVVPPSSLDDAARSEGEPPWIGSNLGMRSEGEGAEAFVVGDGVTGTSSAL